MATGTPQALARRVALLVFLAAALTVMTTTAPTTRAQTPPPEGRVRLTPAMSDVPGDTGAFSVYVVLEDLQHNGSITYDDNRDGTPDRSVPSDGLAAFQVTIEYDAAILAVGTVEPGPELGRSGRAFQCLQPDRKPGSVSFGCISPGQNPAGDQGTLTLASVTIVPQRQGLSPLSLDAALAGPLGDPVTVAIQGGAVRVSGAVPTPTGAPGGSPAPGTGTGPETPPPVATATEPAVGQTTTGTPETTPQPGTPAATVSRPTAPSNGPRPSQSNDGGGNSFGGATLWSVVVAGSVGAAGLLTLAALVWRGRQQRSRV